MEHLSYRLIGFQILIVAILTFKSYQNKRKFDNDQDINHAAEFWIVCGLGVVGGLVLLKFTIYLLASCILATGIGLVYFDPCLNLMRKKPFFYIGEYIKGKSSLIDGFYHSWTKMLSGKDADVSFYPYLIKLPYLAATIIAFVEIIKA